MVRIKYFGMMAVCVLFMVIGRLPSVGPDRGDTMEGMDRQEIEDYFREYWGYRHSKGYEKLENDLIYYFPNLDLECWSWDIVEDRGRGFLLEFYEYPIYGRYRMQYRVHQDLSLELLEDTVQVEDTEEYFCLHLGKEGYVYHGCVIQEYTGVFRLEGGGQGLKAGMPLLSVKESQGWNEVNRNIWEGLEEWYREAERLHMGEVVLEGEIKTLNPEWFSVLFRGTYRENGREEPVAVGITVDLEREKRVRRSYFQENAETDSCYDFYMENDRIYAMDIQGGEYRCRELEQADCAEILEERLDHSVYYESGVGALTSYYDLFFVIPEGGRLEETKKVNDGLEKEMGRFLYGTRSNCGICAGGAGHGRNSVLYEGYGQSRV